METTIPRYRNSVLRLAVIMMMVAALLVAVPAAGAAVTCTVGPGGYASIQAAINDALCDEITVPAGTYHENLSISRDVSIVGAGAATTTIDGSGTGSVATVSGGWTVIDVSFEAVTIANGHATDDGGGIHANIASVALTNSAVRDNTATGGGGGISIESESHLGGAPSLTLTNTVVSGNSADRGGGISTTRGFVAISLIDSDVVGNSASIGGGIYESDSGSILELHNSSVSGNTGTYGAGIFVGYGTLRLTDSEVNNNTSGGFVGQGGGIHVDSSYLPFSSVTLNNTTVSGNDVGGGFGGGILAKSRVDMLVLNSDVSDNSAGHYGGGLYTSAYGLVSVVNTRVSRNAADEGGGIYVAGLGSVAVASSTVSGNSAVTGGGLSFGELDFPDASPSTLVNSTVSGNTATWGGGGIATSDTIVELKNVTVSGNAAGLGAAIMERGEFSSEHAVAVQSSIVNGSCYGNVVSTGPGGNVVFGCSAFLQPTDVVADPNLGVLADNGGPTRTHALLPGSPATDLIVPGDCGLTADQRGVSRPQGAACDAGAFELEVLNRPPVADANGPYTGFEGAPVSLDATGSTDPDSATGDSIVLYEWDLNNDGTYDVSSVDPTMSVTYHDGPLTQLVRLRVTDSFGAMDTNAATVNVANVAPTVESVLVPSDPIPIGTPVPVIASFSDPAGTDDEPYTCDVDYGEANETGIVSGYECCASHTYTEAGIYTIEVPVADEDEGVGTGTAETLVVIYDPDGGFVTGGGWIYSDPGAYVADPTVAGKATFGFVSKYKKGATVPTGNTEFQFRAGDINFHSTSYDWMVVTGSDFAKFKGLGTINGDLAPTGEMYKFQIWAGDDDPDTFRIKIWYEDGGAEVAVYDNGMNQAIGGGSIVIHTKK